MLKRLCVIFTYTCYGEISAPNGELSVSTITSKQDYYIQKEIRGTAEAGIVCKNSQALVLVAMLRETRCLQNQYCNCWLFMLPSLSTARTVMFDIKVIKSDF